MEDLKVQCSQSVQVRPLSLSSWSTATESSFVYHSIPTPNPLWDLDTQGPGRTGLTKQQRRETGAKMWWQMDSHRFYYSLADVRCEREEVNNPE